MNMENENIITLKNVKKSYAVDGKEFNALNETSISFKKGKFYAIVGHSGSGKSTLLQLLGLIKNKTSGNVNILNMDVDNMTPKDKAMFRNKYIGFMFQNFYLDDDISAIENVMLPYYISNKKNYKEKKLEVYQMFKDLNISGKENSKPKELSSGQLAKVSIMRALINNPQIILADEPTGNLDRDNEKIVFEMLKRLANEGKCVIVVSHSSEVKDYCDILISIENGSVSYES